MATKTFCDVCRRDVQEARGEPFSFAIGTNLTHGPVLASFDVCAECARADLAIRRVDRPLRDERGVHNIVAWTLSRL